MIEFVLIAHLHLTDGRLGPDMVIDFYPTNQECRERAENAEDIVAMINQEWYAIRSRCRRRQVIEKVGSDMTHE